MIRVAFASPKHRKCLSLADGDGVARSFTCQVSWCGSPRRHKIRRGLRPMVDPAEVLGGWAEFTLTPPSEYLLNSLRSVGEATASNGAPAYQPDTIAQLITTIASRGYGPLLFRSVHVMSAAAIRNMRLDQLLVTAHPLTARYASQLLFPCLLYTSPSPRDDVISRMPSSA